MCIVKPNKRSLVITYLWYVVSTTKHYPHKTHVLFFVKCAYIILYIVYLLHIYKFSFSYHIYFFFSFISFIYFILNLISWCWACFVRMNILQTYNLSMQEKECDKKKCVRLILFFTIVHALPRFFYARITKEMSSSCGA